MSNFSNIGFSVSTQEEFQQLLEKTFRGSFPVKAIDGTYHVFMDYSGAELYIQLNNENECIGANPHFKGKSKRTVCLTNTVERPDSEMDGAFHCWANPAEPNNPDSGLYPFVFDLPDFKTLGKIDFPQSFDIQLSAFAQEINLYESEEAYHAHQTSEPKFASQSFIPSGLFSFGENENSNPPKAFGFFTGIIKEYEEKRNNVTGENFYWLLVDTLGGEIDVVADKILIESEPTVNGVIQGQFWLSGRLLDPPIQEGKENKSFLRKLFGR